MSLYIVKNGVVIIDLKQRKIFCEDKGNMEEKDGDVHDE